MIETSFDAVLPTANPCTLVCFGGFGGVADFFSPWTFLSDFSSLDFFLGDFGFFTSSFSAGESMKYQT